MWFSGIDDKARIQPVPSGRVGGLQKGQRDDVGRGARGLGGAQRAQRVLSLVKSGDLRPLLVGQRQQRGEVTRNATSGRQLVLCDGDLSPRGRFR